MKLSQHNRRGLRSLFLGLMLVPAALLHAATITWQAAQTITADSDVITAGVPVLAYAVGNAATVNGVAFTKVNLSGLNNDLLTVAGLTSNNQTAFTSTANPFNRLSANYKSILVGSNWSDDQATCTLTFENLVPGRAYLVQVWASDPRALSPARTTTVDGTITLKHCAPNNTVGQPGQFTVGSFVADATTQSFTVKGNNVTQINALQLRQDVLICTTNDDIEWWTPGVWNGQDWRNSTEEFDVYAFLNLSASKTLKIAESVVPAGEPQVLLAGLTIKNTSNNTAVQGENLVFTAAMPFIDTRQVSSQDHVLEIRNVMQSDNPITFYSVGTSPGGLGATGGIRFIKTPQLGTVTMKSGHILLYDEAVTDFSDTIILDGGGLGTRNNNTEMNFPLKIGSAGGWWRTYGTANKVFSGAIADATPGVTGVFYHSDGGTLALTGDLSGFTGTLRNEGGTLRLGNGATVTGYELDAGITGTSDIGVHLNGDMILNKLVDITGTFKKEGDSSLQLSFADNLEHKTGNFAVYGGTLELMDGQVQGNNDVDVHGGDLILSAGQLSVSSHLQIGHGSVTVNGGTLTATHANIVNHSDNRTSSLIVNDGVVSFFATNHVVNSGTGGEASSFRIGHWSNGNGSVAVNGGELHSPEQGVTISWDSPGQLAINDGLFHVYAVMLGCPGRTHQADLTMEGGTLQIGAGGFYRRSNNTTCVFNGGTLASAAPFTFNGGFTLGQASSDALAVDTTDGDITLIGSVTGAGTLVKTGVGTLAFSDLQTALRVNEGTVLPTTANSIPSLTTTSDAALLGLVLRADANDSGSTKYNVDGDVVLADGTGFAVELGEGAFDNGGVYTIIESTGGTITLAGALDAPSLQAKGVDVQFTLSPDSKKLSLVLAMTETSFYWKGGAEGVWDHANASWSTDSQSVGPDTHFAHFGTALFDTISGAAAATVEITPTAVDTRGITVQGTTDYTISGAEIVAATRLTKKGSSTLTLSSPWTSNAPVDLQAGTLNWYSPLTMAASKFSVASGATLALGNSAKVVADANLWSGANVRLDSGTLTVQSGGLLDPLGTLALQDGSLVVQTGTSLGKPFTVSGTHGRVDTSAVGSSTVIDVSGKISGTGSLTLAGNGSTVDSGGGVGGRAQLTNSGNDFKGDVILAAGVIAAESNFGDAANPIVLDGGGTVRTSGAITLSRDLLVDAKGGVLRCYGSLANQQIWTGRFANRTAETQPGDVRQTDGGTIQFLGDISGFTGNYRKVGGGTARLVIGDGSELPCSGMSWASIYANQERVVFNLANQDFEVSFATSGAGALYKQGTGALLWTNTVALAHTGGTFIEAGALKVRDVTQFADSQTIDISAGALLERLNKGALNTGTRKIKGAGTFRLTLDAQSGADIFKGSTEFNGTIDLHCEGGAKLIGLTASQFGGDTTINVNPGALWYVSEPLTLPYNMRIAGIGNNEANHGFGALRFEKTPIMQGDIAVADDARIFGSATLNGTIANDSATVKTLSFGGTYKDDHTIDFNGAIVNGSAPLNLEFLHNNTFNFHHADNSVAAINNHASTLNIKAGAALAVSQPSAGSGTWNFESGSVLGIGLAAGENGRLEANNLSWDNAKLTITGLDPEARRPRTTVLECPSTAIDGLPELTAPLPWPFTLKRIDQNGIARFDVVAGGGTLIIMN